MRNPGNALAHDPFYLIIKTLNCYESSNFRPLNSLTRYENGIFDK
jgi:hypothetical protein